MTWRHGQQIEGYKSRSILCQIDSVNPEAGTVNVVSPDMLGRWTCTIPLQGLSVQGTRSSWLRYMPQRYDYVNVGFDTLGRPHILGYIPSEIGPQGAHAYTTMTERAKEFKSGLGMFRPLKPGEWDGRSSGGAFFKGSATGRLTVGAGLTRLYLDKLTDELRGRASLTVLGGDGCEIRVGAVKRALPTSLTGSEIEVAEGTGTFASGAQGAAKEWRVRIEYKARPTGTPTLTAYEEQAGDCRDELGVPRADGPTHQPLRYIKKLYDDTGLLATLSVYVDNTGNVNIVQGDQAVSPLGGLSFDGAASGSMSINVGSFSLTTKATGLDQITFSCNKGLALNGGVSASINAASVSLGMAATEPAVLGTKLVVMLTALASGLATIKPNSPDGTAAASAVTAALPVLLSTSVTVSP